MAAFHFSIFTGIGLNLNVFPVSRRLAAILKNANYVKTSMENNKKNSKLKSAHYYL